MPRKISRPFMDRARAKVWENNNKSKARGVRGDLTIDQWLQILEQSEGRCYYCEDFIGIDALTLEHLVPASLGGPCTVENVVAACQPCNRKQYKTSWRR